MQKFKSTNLEMALNSISFSQVFLAMAVLLLISRAKAVDFCSTAEGDEKAMCATLVDGAANKDAALTNVVNGILSLLEHTENGKTLFDGLRKKMPSTLKPASKSGLEQTCKESFEGVTDGLKTVLDNIKTGDPFQSTSTDLSAVASSLTTCVDELAQFGIKDHALTQVAERVKIYVNIAFSVINSQA